MVEREVIKCYANAMGFLVYIRGRVSVKRCCVLREALCPTDDMSMLTQTFFTGAETNRMNTQSAQVPESCNYNFMGRLLSFSHSFVHR